MFNIDYKINGRNVRGTQFRRELEKAALAEVIKEVKRKVAGIRCRQHGQAARVVAEGPSLTQLSFQVSGCCNSLIRKVQDAL